MPLPKIQITLKKDGRQVAWFRDTAGRVRTSTGSMNWTRAEQIRDLANFGILRQLAQLDAGLGSDGQPMKPLAAGYAQWKSKVGLEPKRNLLGLGGLVKTVNPKTGAKRILHSATHMSGRGHLRDDIRINQVDDRQATISITNTASRNKARGNERRAPWWGWSPESARQMTARAAQIFQTGVAEYLYTMGLIGANALSEAKTMWRKVA